MSGNSGKVPALKLTLGGAPFSWHTISNLAYVHPTIPSPVDGPGECTLEQAKALAEDEGAEVELVYVTEKQAEDGRAARELARDEGISAARETRRQGKKATAEEAERFNEEAATAAATAKGAK
jgi:hypothetical protein